MACCQALQRPGWAVPRASPLPTAAATSRRPPVAPHRTWQHAMAAVRGNSSSGNDGSSNSSGPSSIANSSNSSVSNAGSGGEEEAVLAAQERLHSHLQQLAGISQREAAQLAGLLSKKLGVGADQVVLPPMQFFIGRGMRLKEAAALVVHICKHNNDASIIRHWLTWQPVVEANRQLCDSHLAAYQEWCRANKQRPLKGSQSMAVMLSSMPSRYMLLVANDLPSKVALLQSQLGLTDAEVGAMIAAGAVVNGSHDTIAAAIQWLLRFNESRQAAVSMLRKAPLLLSYSTVTLESKVAALQAAWAGVLQPGQVRRLVQRAPRVLNPSTSRYSATGAVLQGWFPQPEELRVVLHVAPELVATSATTLQANERWLTGPPLNLSTRQFLKLVQASPQTFFMSFADARAQHKLAFLTQIAGVPLSRAFSAHQLGYLKSSPTALAGRYFLLVEHGVPVPPHKDGGIGLSYAVDGLPSLLGRMRAHDSKGRLPADDNAALDYLRKWLDAWPETESGRQWAKPPAAGPEP